MTLTSSHRPGADPAGSPGSEARTGFDHVYDQPGPRGYFQALGPFGYQTPHHAQRVFRRLVSTLAPSNAGQRVTVLTICCSYGINAALLNHNLTLADLQHLSRGQARRYAGGLAAIAAGITGDIPRG